MTRVGPLWLRVKFADHLDDETLARGRGVVRALETHRSEDLTDVVPAYGEVLLEFRDGKARDRDEARLRAALKEAEPIGADEAPRHEIPVWYDGPDLAELARLKGLTVDEVVQLHTSPEYTVYQIGFSPGFPYLGPLDPRLHAPRLAQPRTHIAPGSVGIGGEHTGIYSVASAGGWRLIGRTETALFQPGRAREEGSEAAFLLRQGDRVKFVPQS